MQIRVFLFCFGVGCLYALCGYSASIPDQPGQDILCSGPLFTYQHDVRQHGVDVNLKITGDGGFTEESGVAYASYYTDAYSNHTAAVYEYSFVTQPGEFFGDVRVATRAFILRNAGTISGHYRIGDGPWIEFLFERYSGDYRPVDVLENIHASRISIRYSLDRNNYQPWEGDLQLFRSSHPDLNHPGDYAFTFEAEIVTDTECHTADLAGAFGDAWVDWADFAALASDYGLTGSGLAGDLDGNETCDAGDLQWLAAQWFCDCYPAP